MHRRIASCLALSALLLLPGCKKKDSETGDEGDEAKDKVAADAGKADEAADAEEAAELPPPTPANEVPAADSGAAGSGGAGGGSGAAGSGGGSVPAPVAEREDLSCDPTDKGGCLEGEQCIGGSGCDADWQCDATIVCKKGVREYCGCDGRTFEAVYGNCPWQRYEYEGPCK
ncbi:hypothetical protein ENSA5_05480 [Enhygromyxa salina]|uniref:Uncharacterized protein n=1 Tax=Enhygromyxa salina TaxID=215803 RepID=A0A2S9YHZ6_9BACT|nr:hypothetical protein [Enhygromyxa salina]PRQ04699.1 hypothetical protein ENSA5_05480 [Enhygromyxa salina]